MPTDSPALAQQLFDAWTLRDPIAFISRTHDVDENAGYAIQDLLVDKLLAADGACVAGYKISLTSAATQQIAQTHEPAYGTLLSSHIVPSGASISFADLLNPLLEVEIVFVLHEDLSPDPQADEVIAHCAIAPAIEIPDGRYIDWFPNFTLGDLLADDAATGRVVIGPEVTAPASDELAQLGVKLTLDGVDVTRGSAGVVMGNPVNAIRWLARKLAGHGKRLRKGQIVSSGTLITPLVAKHGTYVAEFSGLGTVQVTLVD